MLTHFTFPANSFTFGAVNYGMFFLAVSIIAAYQITWAPYVADYSRYLPRNTSVASTFTYTYLGLVLSCCWMDILGVFLIAALPAFEKEPTNTLSGIFASPMSEIVLAVIVVGVTAASILNLYGAFMAVVTTVEPFTKLKVTAKVRIILFTVLAIICTAVADGHQRISWLTMRISSASCCI